MSDTKSTLIAALPLLFIIGALVAAIIILPQTDLDTRDRAAEPVPTTTQQRLPPGSPPESETACTTLYSPVCGEDNKTYNSSCEALNAGVQIAYSTPCTTTSPTPTVYIKPGL